MPGPLAFKDSASISSVFTRRYLFCDAETAALEKNMANASPTKEYNTMNLFSKKIYPSAYWTGRGR